MMLFKIDRRNHIVMVNEALKLTSFCKKLQEEELRFIVLAYDYHSPLKQYPLSDRVRKAKRMVWGKDDSDLFFPEDQKQMAAAIEEYVSLQYDPIRQTIEAYKSKIEMLNVRMIDSNKIGEIAKLDADISTLHDRMKLLQEEVDRAENDVKLKGKGDKLSAVEIWQRNRINAKRDQRLKAERESKEITHE